ncbi:MAG: adenosine deaminase [Acidobacteriaceae bacterium]
MLPKVELHLHLDCSLSYDVVRALRPAISKDIYREEFIAPQRCTNLADFLKRAPKGIELMQTEAELSAVVADLFQQLLADNVIYAEIRFAPLLHLAKGMTPQAVVEIVNDATERAIRETGIEARLILCTLRHFNTEQGLATAKLVKQFAGTKVVALDLAGDEAGFPITPHIPAYEFARANNLCRTAHAGEAAGAESVWDTLRLLQPQRIGHGVRSTEDVALLEFLREQQIHLEVCPSSNLQTNVYSEMAGHALDDLYRAGLSVGISTDARTITDVTLEQEYEKMRQVFGWTDQELLQCNLNALRAAFVPDDLKHKLELRLKSGQ